MPQFLLEIEYKVDLVFRYLFWYFIIPSMLLLACFMTFETSRRIILDMYHTLFG